MRHRLYIAQPLTLGEQMTITGEELHHARVLRLHEGEEIEVFDGLGGAFVARVGSVDRVQLTATTIGTAPSRESSRPVTLAMAVIQLDKFELVLQKATELGAAAIVPLVTTYVELRPERYRGKEERWRKILFEAVKQSGRSVIPNLESPLNLAEMLKRGGTKVFFDADAEPSPTLPAEEAVTLFIGPEGGWAAEELDLAGEYGCIFRRLGPRRLRAETAAIAAMAMFSG